MVLDLMCCSLHDARRKWCDILVEMFVFKIITISAEVFARRVSSCFCNVCARFLSRSCWLSFAAGAAAAVDGVVDVFVGGVIRSESLRVTIVASTCFIRERIDSFSVLVSAVSSFFRSNFCCWICSSNRPCFLRWISRTAFFAASFFETVGADATGFFVVVVAAAAAGGGGGVGTAAALVVGAGAAGWAAWK